MLKVLSLLLLLLVSSTLGSEWKQLDELESMFEKYSISAKRILIISERSITNIRIEATELLDGFSEKFNISISPTSNRNKCAKHRTNFQKLKTSFLEAISRSELPLLTHILELKERLSAINSSIRMHLSLANSKFWSCKLHDDTCTEQINSWLEKVLPKIACKLSEHCKDDKREARSIKRRECSAAEFTCRDGSCTSAKSVCDGKVDCRDGSDEPKGCTRICKDGFHCTRTFRCIDNSMVCNGRDDCGDSSDESNCSTVDEMEDCTLAHGYHRCDKCITLDLVCNGHRDCKDGSDEGSQCGLGTCPSDCTKTGGVCFFGPLGPICLPECPLGIYESVTGCSSKPKHRNTNAMALLEQISVLSARHNSRFSNLKANTIVAFSNVLGGLIRCENSMTSN